MRSRHMSHKPAVNCVILKVTDMVTLFSTMTAIAILGDQPSLTKAVTVVTGTAT